MSRTTDRKHAAIASSGVAFAAVMLAAPALAAPAADPQAAPTSPSARSVDFEKHIGQARSIGHIKYQSVFKYKGEYSVAGVGDGHVVFEDERGNLFYVDDATGDQKFVSHDIFIKISGKTVPWATQKGHNKVTIVGVDQSGKTIMTNPKGEKFFLDAATGDMIFVK